MKHKHAGLIKQWADGAEIEFKMPDGRWRITARPVWHESDEYRIKPEEKKPVVRWLWAGKNSGSLGGRLMTEEEAKNTGWDLKLEWSRTEFPE